MNVLYTCLTGSKLYGTDTPKSDTDRKSIILPDMKRLLAGTGKIAITNRNTNTSGQSNTKDDEDHEYIPLQRFAHDFIKGQSYALEMAFSLEAEHAEPKVLHPEFTEFVKELRTKFLTNRISGMMGFIMHSTSSYTKKIEYFNCLSEFKKLVDDDILENGSTSLQTRMETGGEFVSSIINFLTKYGNLIETNAFDGNHDKSSKYIMINKTKFMLEYPTNDISNRIQKALGVYGDRVKNFSDGGVDWKSLSHAIRVSVQCTQILKEHKIVFPIHRSDADYIKAVKLGTEKVEHVMEQLYMMIDYIRDLEKQTTLQEYDQKLQVNFETWLENRIMKFYTQQITL